MSFYRSRCSSFERLSKITLLAMLESNLDFTRIILKPSGEVITVGNMNRKEINQFVGDTNWTYYETYQPRRMLVTNENWSIISFDSRSRNVCISLRSPNGTKTLNITLPELNAKFNKTY